MRVRLAGGFYQFILNISSVTRQQWHRWGRNMLIPTKLAVGSTVLPLSYQCYSVGGWLCAATFSNIPTIHLSKLEAKCNGCLYTVGLLVSVFIIISISGLFTVRNILFKLNLTFSFNSSHLWKIIYWLCWSYLKTPGYPQGIIRKCLAQEADVLR